MDSLVCKHTSGGDTRTGTFYKMPSTMGDTAYSVNGVLDKYSGPWICTENTICKIIVFAVNISLLGHLQNKKLIPVVYISNQNYLQNSYTNKNSYAK